VLRRTSRATAGKPHDSCKNSRQASLTIGLNPSFPVLRISVRWKFGNDDNSFPVADEKDFVGKYSRECHPSFAVDLLKLKRCINDSIKQCVLFLEVFTSKTFTLPTGRRGYSPPPASEERRRAGASRHVDLSSRKIDRQRRG
jgi:hypothetical protein